MSKMISFDLIPCIVWIILAAFVAFQSIRLNLGRLVDPGPGFLPFCSSVILGLLALFLLFSRLFKKRSRYQIKAVKPEGFQLGQLWSKAAYLMAGSFIYVYIMWEKIGYLISTAVFLFFLLKFVGTQSFKRSLIVAIGGTIVSYLIFETWLQCMLPKGLLKSLNF
jgi:putative tricarboxylic transport membrane protein